ncbi:snare associated Golgi protein family domain-containing protein [Cyclospora cayetanensis]|uniref:Snare associated Golgi protein family domain-containing protein n=1 Tax=Cyclospora cayetanensis TaxID=88456 RepID=A0A1D3D588_9EIME|nr:snare associated Golgi protein family domain-containing protein [Cyclospora cayetanensis]
MAVTLLLGALYSPLFAFSLASLLSAVGPSLAYFMFKASGRPLVVRFFPNQLQRMRRLIHPKQSSGNRGRHRSPLPIEHKEIACKTGASATHQKQSKTWETQLDLMLTILFLRVSPFPNLVINAAFSMGSALGSLDSLSSGITCPTPSPITAVIAGWRPFAVFAVGAVAVALLKAALKKFRPSRFVEEEAVDSAE